jgi:hypothetical protein
LALRAAKGDEAALVGSMWRGLSACRVGIRADILRSDLHRVFNVAVFI